MTSSLVGSEMCIRDRQLPLPRDPQPQPPPAFSCSSHSQQKLQYQQKKNCLLYTSDAADDM
eukprot:12817562-Prorocentrum_lima.AAC.1